MKKTLKLIILLLCTAQLVCLYSPISPNAYYSTSVSYAKAASSKNTLPLILDSTKTDYKSHIPKLKCSKGIKEILDIENPDLSLDAASAILFDASTGEVLYHKNAVKAVFPASTVKLLNALVALDYCDLQDKITIGDEISLIASDSSRAGLVKGEKFSVQSLLCAMLLPSGNDAAYAMATYIGRIALDDPKASSMKAIKKFVRLMNKKAEELGAENSCFITPDGYDALGQYTTAYDMGRIGIAAACNSSIRKVTQKGSVSTTLLSGEKCSWQNTNQLVNKSSIWYHSNVVGLKTGTTTMAGRCLISAAENENGTVVSVVLNSTSMGRYRDSTRLLNYGLKVLGKKDTSEKKSEEE